jgi:hypothetical protein
MTDMNTDTAMPQTAETAKIARRNDNATVVWFTCGSALRKNTVIPATIKRARRLRIVRRWMMGITPPILAQSLLPTD